MEENKNSVDVTREMKRAQKKAMRKAKWDSFKADAKDFWEDNKFYIAVIGPAAVAGVAKVIKVFGRTVNLKLEERNKDLRVYDPTIGHYWELKRKLNNTDWLYINRRKTQGASYGDILDELKVLK